MRVLYLLGWAGLLVAAVGLVARFLPVTNHATLTAAALSPYLMAGAGVAAVILVLLRRWWTASAAGLLTAVAVAVQLPLFIGPEHSAHNTVSARVLTANVLEGRANPAQLAAIVRDRADIVVFQEITPDLVSALNQEGLGTDFPYQATDARRYAEGVAVWSRYPIDRSTRIPGFQSGVVSAEIRIPGAAADTTVVVVHISGPWPQPIDDWRRDLDKFPEAMDAIAAKAGTGAVIMAGDVNATTGMAPSRRLLRDGFRDGTEQAGAGFIPTFPADASFPPLIGIDHILTRNSWAQDVRSVRIPGSDHLGLQATVQVRSQ